MAHTHSISIHDMQRYAERVAPPEISISTDVGNVIQLGANDFDDLGMNLLANNRVSARPAAPSTNGTQVSFTAPAQSASSQDFSLGPIEPLEPISLDIPSENSLGPNPDITVNRVTDSVSASAGADGTSVAVPFFSDNGQTATGPSISLSPPVYTMRMSPEEERAKKADLINKLTRLEAKGFQVSKRFTMDNSLEEIELEFNRLMDARNLEGSIKFQRQMMMGFVTGLELMNNKFNPFDWQLEGWSESVHESIDDFDEVFEELYDKYKGRGAMPPEARLVFMLAGSGFMFHMSNNFFRSKVQNMDMGDILRNNPALAKQFATAAAQAAGPGFGNFMGMTMGVPQSAPAPAQSQVPLPPQNAFFNSPNAPMSSQTPPVRREMKGPSGVDDILKTFEEVRSAEMNMGSVNPVPVPISAVSPSFQVQPQPQSARQALSELQSIHSEEMLSQAESTRTGRTAGGGRRRKPTIPVGNTLSLNV
jgi:hypothetical protein